LATPDSVAWAWERSRVAFYPANMITPVLLARRGAVIGRKPKAREHALNRLPTGLLASNTFGDECDRAYGGFCGTAGGLPVFFVT
jgi:hypothetical protein